MGKVFPIQTKVNDHQKYFYAVQFKNNERKKVVEKKNLNMILCVLFALFVGFGVSICDSNAYNTTAVATNIESTIGSPGILVDPTLITTRNTTVEQYEVSVLYHNF